MPKVVDTNDVGELERVVLRILNIDDDPIGTAFFLSPTRLLTCKHVLVKRQNPDVYLASNEMRLLGAWGPASFSPTSVWYHPSYDIALLDMDESLEAALSLPLQFSLVRNSDDVLLCGYSTRHGRIERRPFRVVGFDNVRDMSTLQGEAAKGLSGGPVLHNGMAVGIGCAYGSGLTFFRPLARLTGLPPDPAVKDAGMVPPSQPSSGRDKAPTIVGSIHLHIDGGEDLAIARSAAAVIDSGADRTEITTIEKFTDGPQRKQYGDLYNDHTPTLDGYERLGFFTTTMLHDGTARVGTLDVAQVEHNVMRVLSHVAARAARQGAAPGSIVVEAERVIGAVAADGTATWSETQEMNNAFGPPFLFGKRAFEGRELFELHVSVDVPRSGDLPPFHLHTMRDASNRARIPVGGWFMFAKAEKWAYRSNSFVSVITKEDAQEMRDRMELELSRLHGVDPTGVRVRLLAEQSLGVWKTPFEKRVSTGISVDELAAWEGSRPDGSEFWVVTGNFLGDHDASIQDAMVTNLTKGIHYKYFLRSYADLKRWLNFRGHLEKRLDGRMQMNAVRRQMTVFVLEFTNQEIWHETLDCFISRPDLSKAEAFKPEAFKLLRDGRTDCVTMGMPMDSSQIDEVHRLLARPLEGRAIVSSRRFLDEPAFEGAIIWMDFGLFEFFAKGNLDRKQLSAFVDDFDGTAASHVSRFGGEVIRSNEVCFVVMLARTSQDDDKEIVSRTYHLLNALLGVMRHSLEDTTRRVGKDVRERYRVVADYGSGIRRIVRSNGQTVDGDTLARCRATVPDLEPGSIEILRDLERMAEEAGIPRDGVSPQATTP